MTIEEHKQNILTQASNGKRWCYDCINFYRIYFCGYGACTCKIHGSLDMDQKERHPDKTADTCENYEQKSGKRWYEKWS